MTSMRICPTHEMAHEATAGCPYCEPIAAVETPESVGARLFRELYDRLTYAAAASCGIPLDVVRGDAVSCEDVGGGRFAVSMKTRRVTEDDYECARQAGAPLDRPVNHSAGVACPGGVVRDRISDGNILAVGVVFPERGYPTIAELDDAFAELRAIEHAKLETSEQYWERRIIETMRASGVSEADIAHVIANKATSIGRNDNGGFTVVLPGHVSDVRLSFGFTLDEP